ncbi:Glyoxalase-like domain protein [Tsuneonella dongtanensis]|uniref:Glyoxalase-like domain protein n=1 Tax=Tsuneonella dongtanensis TaxID=692370 RepID=A0A1B2A8Q9_9SPHN|nr:VOC family protein [Tsuneonella dongtanensis]ANY18550.1 Glyoxalase-like domain protein [Tsuneonella dongtanensis]
MSLRPFHLAVPVRDIAEARAFYGGVLGLPEGRSAEAWVDFDFFGHQFVVHHAPQRASGDAAVNPVDGHGVPVPHFGVVLTLEAFDALAAKMRDAGTRFDIEPYTRFAGEPGEQKTMFFRDPSGNAIEMKAFASLESLFAT